MSDERAGRFRWLERGAGSRWCCCTVSWARCTLGRGAGGGSRRRLPGDRAHAAGLQPDLREATVGALGRYVLRFLDALDIPRAVLGGNSLGGHVALRLALEHPDAGVGAGPHRFVGPVRAGFASGVPHRPDRAWVRRKMEEVFWDPALVTDGWVEDVHRLVTTPASALRILRLARDARRDNLEAATRRDPGADALDLGLRRSDHAAGGGRALPRLIPDTHLWHLSECGHTPMLERPAVFADVLVDWLEGTKSRREIAVPQLGGVR